METKITPKNAKIFSCKTCNFECFKQSDFNRHILTAKHKNRTNRTEKTPKNANNFYCGPGGFNCWKKSDWDRHIITLKHKKNDNDAQKNANTFSCENCGKNYKYRQGLYAHKKKCPLINNTIAVQENPEEKPSMMEILSQILPIFLIMMHWLMELLSTLKERYF